MMDHYLSVSRKNNKKMCFNSRYGVHYKFSYSEHHKFVHIHGVKPTSLRYECGTDYIHSLILLFLYVKIGILS